MAKIDTEYEKAYNENKELHVAMYNYIIEHADEILSGKSSVLELKRKFCSEKNVHLGCCFEFAGNLPIYCKDCPIDCHDLYPSVEKALTKEDFIKAIENFRDSWK